MPTLNYEIFQTSRKVESFAVNTSPTIYILLQFITYFFIYAVLYPSVIPPYFLMWVSYRLYSYFLLFGIQFVPDLVSDLRMLFTNAWIYLLDIITLERILSKHSEYIKMRSRWWFYQVPASRLPGSEGPLGWPWVAPLSSSIRGVAPPSGRCMQQPLSSLPELGLVGFQN